MLKFLKERNKSLLYSFKIPIDIFSLAHKSSKYLSYPMYVYMTFPDVPQFFQRIYDGHHDERYPRDSFPHLSHFHITRFRKYVMRFFVQLPKKRTHAFHTCTQLYARTRARVIDTDMYSLQKYKVSAKSDNVTFGTVPRAV